MFSFLPFSLGRISGSDLKTIATSIQKTVTRRSPNGRLDCVIAGNTKNVARMEVLPSTPIWPGVWKESLRNIAWVLRIPYSKRNFKSVLPILASHPNNFSVSCEIVWPNRRVFALRQELKSIQEPISEAYWLYVDFHIRRNYSVFLNELKATLSELLPLWGAEGMMQANNDLCYFTSERKETAHGLVFASNGLSNDRSADSLSYSDIESFDFASKLADQSLPVLLKHFKMPRLIELKIASFKDVASDCASFCREIAPQWYCNFHPEPRKSFDPFKPPSHNAGIAVYPVVWNEFRKDEVDMEDFMDMYLAVEHSPQGSSLLFATNHDDSWLLDVAKEAGCGKSFELLGDQEKYANVDQLKHQIKAIARR